MDAFGVGDGVMVVGTVVLIASLTVAAVGTARALGGRSIDFNPLLQPVDIGLRLVLLLACLGLAAVSSLPPAQFGFETQDAARAVALGAVAGVALAAGVLLVGTLGLRLLGPNAYSTRLVLALVPRTRLQWVLVPAAMLPAVALEEVLFRSLVLGGIGAWIDPLALAIGASVLFGVLHLPQGQLGVILAGAASLVLSLLFLREQSLLVVVVAHYVVNVGQLILAGFQREELEAAARQGR